jgi:DNA-binding FadR family transcriptional regulator
MPAAKKSPKKTERHQLRKGSQKHSQLVEAIKAGDVANAETVHYTS